jgi:tripartite-type tricarboxylate transporter receptor subunit TctC
MTRRAYLLSIAAVGLLQAVPGASLAQDNYPTRPIKMIVSYAAGGTTDTMARVTAQKMSEILGQPIVIENKPGAGTIIAAEVAANSPADGYTLFMTATTTLSVNPATYRKLPYRIEDFAPISLIGKMAYTFGVSNTLAVKDLKEFVAYTKARPGQLNYGTVGLGGSTHIFTKLVEGALGVQMQDVIYKGSPPALTDLFAGTIQVYADGVISSLPFHQDKKMNILAVSSEQRLAAAPEIPTFTELGYPSVVLYSYYGVLAPAKTPAPIVAKLNAAMVKALAMPDLQERIRQNGAVPESTTPEGFGKVIADYLKAYGDIARPLNFNLE